MQQNWNAVKNCGCVKEENLKMDSRNVVENPKFLSEGGAEQEGICERSELAETLVCRSCLLCRSCNIFKKNLTDGLILEHVTNLSVALQDGCDFLKVVNKLRI